MAYPPNPAAPSNQPRPATVTVSSFLLWLTAALSLIGAAVTLSMVGRMADAYRDLYAGTAAEGSEAVIIGTSVVVVVISVLFAAGLAILAIFNNRGRQGARVTTWVLGGITLCCSGLGLATNWLWAAVDLESTGNTGGPSPAEAERRLNEALPSWYEPLSTTLSVISLLAILAAVILLALPASNAYFRKPAGAGWDPSVPYQYPPSGQPPMGQLPYPPYPSAQGESRPGEWRPSESAPPPPGPPPGEWRPGDSAPPAPPAPGPPPGEWRPGGSAPGGSAPQSGAPSDPWGRPPDDRRPPPDSAS